MGAQISGRSHTSGIGNLLEPIRKRSNLPGMGCLVISDDKVLAEGCCGLRALGRGIPIQLSDRWHLGSCTKAMTATLIALLEEEGALSLGAAVTSYLKVSCGARAHEGWDQVTLDHLMCHTGGVPGDLLKHSIWKDLWRAPDGVTGRRLFVDWVLQRPPGKLGEYEYANGGYMLLGSVVAAVTGRCWEEVITQKLFAPLKMTSIGFGAPGTKSEETRCICTSPYECDEPWGHQQGKAYPGVDNPEAVRPAGGLHMSLKDWARFVSMHLRGARGEEGLLLKPSTFTKLHQVFDSKSQYSRGWIVTTEEWGDGPVLQHAGSNTFWLCQVWVAPKKNFACLVACNELNKGAGPALDEARELLVERYIGTCFDVHSDLKSL